MASRLAAIAAILRRNGDLLRNAGSLLATTGLTSVFGFAFWIYAAKVFPQQAVGYGSAGISAMTLLGTIGMFGLSTTLIGELPQRSAKGGLISAALLASGLGSLVLGAAFALTARSFSGSFAGISGSPGRMLLFAAGVALTGSTLVFDAATIGLMWGSLQLWRNVALAVAKMAALPVTAIVLHDKLGVGLMLAWVLGTVVSLAPAAVMIRRAGHSVLHRPDWGVLRRLGKVAMTHNWLNLAIAAPTKLFPVLVTVIVSPSANATFYVAWMIASFLFMVPSHLSTVLFAIASATPEIIGEKLRFVLRLSLVIGLPAMLVLGAGSHVVLGLFGSRYAAIGTLPLCLLLVSYIPGLPKAQYIAVCRATGRVSRAAVVLTLSAVGELAAVVIGGKLGGLNGLSWALLIATAIEGAVTTPAVLRTAYGRQARQAPRPAARPASAEVAVTRAQPILAHTAADRPRWYDAALRSRQEAGLTALMSIAAAPTPDKKTQEAVTDSWRVAADSAARPAAQSPGRGRHRRPAAAAAAAAATAAGTGAGMADTGAAASSAVPSPAASWYTARTGELALDDPALNDPVFLQGQESGMAALIAIATHAARF